VAEPEAHGPNGREPVDVDPCGQRQFIGTHYLERLLPEGAGKLKVVLGPPGSGRTHFLRALAQAAAGAGYLVAHVDASRDPLWGFDQLYRAAAGRLDLAALGRAWLSRLIGELGYEGVELRDGSDLGVWARATGHAEAPLRVRVDEALHARLVDNPEFDRGYATGLLRWCQLLLWGGGADDLLLVDAWLRGSRVSARECNRLRVRRPVDRFTGRLWFRSFLRLVRLAGRRGLVVVIDHLDAVLATGRGQASAGAPAGASAIPGGPEATVTPHYTRQRRDDFYECLRAVVDETAAMPGLLMVLAGPRALLTDGRSGVASYPALAQRVQSEVVTAEVNRFSDEIGLERLWDDDAAARAALATGWLYRVCPEASETLLLRATAAAEAAWRAVRDPGQAALRRSIDAVMAVASHPEEGQGL
jgi:hypothetical protein